MCPSWGYLPATQPWTRDLTHLTPCTPMLASSEHLQCLFFAGHRSTHFTHTHTPSCPVTHILSHTSLYTLKYTLSHIHLHVHMALCLLWVQQAPAFSIFLFLTALHFFSHSCHTSPASPPLYNFLLLVLFLLRSLAGYRKKEWDVRFEL